MKIYQPASLVRRVCHLWPASLIRHKFHLSLSLLFLIAFLLVQMMTTRMKILLHLLKLFLLLPSFQDGSALLGMQQVLLQVTLLIENVHVLSSKELLPYWLKFQKILIQKPLKKPPIIQLWMKL